MSILLFNSVIFFTINKPINIQCINNVTPSNQGNNILCFIQGSILVFSTFSTIIWISILIVNFHIKTFWSKYKIYFNNQNITFEITNYKITYFFGWVLPLLLTLICIFLKSISYELINVFKIYWRYFLIGIILDILFHTN